MKNFRKVLALVLVVATLFSFTAMTSAKTYTDEASISYNEAVDVLSYVGILNGYEDDSFKPTQTISREEMAKMIAVLANAGTDVSTLYASASTFADVPTVRWSASYVAYCAKTGIVAGRSASTFDPTAKVTGLETAKMLLVVLGFDAEEQGYVGADWKVNVLRDAKVMGLLNNFADKYDVEAAITREEAAQMMLNALEAPCVVGLLSKNTVTVTNALVFGGYKWENQNLTKVSSWATLLDAFKAGNWALYGNVVISDDVLAEVLFGLKKTENSAVDCYMRPGNFWTWVDAKGNTVKITGTTNKAAWSSYNTNTKEIEKYLGTYNLNKYAPTFYSDGKVVDFVEGGKGALVEIYVVGNELRVVEINTYVDVLAKVDTYHKTITLNGKTYNNVPGFKATDVGSVVLYWLCNDGLHTAEIVKPAATAQVTKAVKNNNTEDCYFVAGNKYEYAKNFNITMNDELYVMGEVVEGKAYGVGTEFDIYTDKYGFVMYYAPVVAATDYKYAVVDYGSATATKGAYNKATGTFDMTYTVKMVNFETNPAVGAAVGANALMFKEVDNSTNGCDTLVKYYVDANGNVCLDETWNTNRVALEGVNMVLKASDMYTNNGKYMNANTQILLRVENPMNGKTEYKYFNGYSEIDAAYVIDNLSYYFSGRNMTYVYAEAEYAKANTAAYFLGKAESVVYLTDGNMVVGYNTYDAIVDGEEAVVATKLEKIEDFNTVYALNLVCIGLTTDDKAPVYYALTEVEALASKYVNELDVDSGRLFYNDELVGKLDDKASFMMFFVDGWGDEAYTTITAEDLVEYIYDWNHANVWVFDLDGDGDIDLVYVNAQDGYVSHGAK